MPHKESDPGNVDMIARLITAAGKRLGGYDPDQLARLRNLNRVLDRALVDAVAGQRAAGVTWRAIGEGLGVTKEAVVQQFGPEIRSRAGTHYARQQQGEGVVRPGQSRPRKAH